MLSTMHLITRRERKKIEIDRHRVVRQIEKISFWGSAKKNSVPLVQRGIVLGDAMSKRERAFPFRDALRRASRGHVDVLQRMARDSGFVERPFLARECPRHRSWIHHANTDRATSQRAPRSARIPTECERRTSDLLGSVC